jgi:hypothetical protein
VPAARRHLPAAAAVLLLLCAGAGGWYFSAHRGTARSAAVPSAPAAGLSPTAPVPGRQWYVAPEGRAGNSGDQQAPFGLREVLEGKTPVGPGDTVWVGDGVYRGPFVSNLRGTEQAPIVVRAAASARAVIDGAPSSGAALYIQGAWTTYWGLEVTNSSPHAPFGFSPTDTLTRGMGIEVRAPRTKLINNIVHDGGGGLGIWSDAEYAEAYGNLIYYNGFIAPDRGHGHGIYTQNRTGERLLADNVIFANYDHGIHAYGSSEASLDHITLEGNVSFNNGLGVGADGAERYAGNILLGGGRAAVDPVVRQNYTYFSDGARVGGDNNFGFSAGCSNLVARGNLFAGGIPIILGGGCGGTILDNLFYGPVAGEIRERYAQNSYLTELPSDTRVIVRPNRYEPGRAHVIVYNWDRWRTVTVDLAPARLAAGSRFEIRDAQNFFGEPVYAGVYDRRPVALTVRGLQAAAPVQGMETPPHSAPQFVVFIVLPLP